MLMKPQHLQVGDKIAIVSLSAGTLGEILLLMNLNKELST